MTLNHSVSAVSGFRRSIQILYPMNIPHESAVLDATRRWKLGGRADGQAMGRPSAHGATHGETAARLKDLLAVIPQGEGWVSCVSEQYDDAAHDAYFQVARVRGDAAEVFVRMVFAARLCLIEDVGRAGITMELGAARADGWSVCGAGGDGVGTRGVNRAGGALGAGWNVAK